jgi:hypothetical protein
MLGVTLNVDAPVVAQVNVTNPPAGTEFALEENVTVGGAAVTVTVTVDVFVPPAPVAVAVYVVVALTVTGCVPETGSALGLIDGVIVSEVAFVVAHVKFTILPAFALWVSALNVIVGAAGGGGGGVDVDELPPQAARPSSTETIPRTNSDCNRRRGTGIPQFVSCLT